jgi:inorganic pyrophosphatase
VIIYGVALGYKSAVIPITILCVDIFVSFYLLGMYGVALCALGMLASLSSSLTIDVYGPVCDNGGGFAEMAGMHEARSITDALDAAGNTTAAIGKGFAIGSAALVSLSLLGAFITRVRQTNSSVLCAGAVDFLQPINFACLVFGAMIPYWFAALTLKSVGKAAMAMVKEIARQFREIEGLLAGKKGVKPETDKCIRIATQAALKEMILPGLLIIFTPLIVGILLGVNALAGFLAGAMASGVQIAISMSNTGGAWDNAKKYVESKQLFFERNGVKDTEPQVKGSEAHKAAVVGDTVGDPFKDTTGPAINIVMKLMAILSLVFADFFMSINSGYGGFNIIPNCQHL